MRCRSCRWEIGTSLQGGRGELSPPVTAHIAECPECDEFAGECAATSLAVGSLPVVDAPDDFALRLRSRLASERPAPQVGWLEAWRTPVLPARQAYLAAAVLVVAIVLLGVAINGLMPMAGFGLGHNSPGAIEPFAGVGLGTGMTASYVVPMVRQHQTQQIASPWHHDAGYYMVMDN